MYERIKGWFSHSLTIAWSYLLMAAGLLIDVVPMIGSPEVSKMLPPQYLGWYTIAVGVITYLARRRSL